MKRFAALVQALDETTKTNAKVSALATYFMTAPDRDKLWTIALLSHRRPRRTIKTSLMREWAAELAEVPLWLFEESYHVVGDLAETIALVLPKPSRESDTSLADWLALIQSWREKEDVVKKEEICHAWTSLNHRERFVFNKLITGGFRLGVSQKLMTRALAKATEIDESILAHRLMGDWSPQSTTFEELILSENPADALSKPYPFYLAYALDASLESLDPPGDWQAERKWDGIRGQVIKRAGSLFIWSRGEELMTDRFPELHAMAETLPDGVVVDGELLPYKEGRPMTFQHLQTRIGRKKVTKTILEKVPVVLVAYDLLEYGGADIRAKPLSERRSLLEDIVKKANVPSLLISELVPFGNWGVLTQERENSREHASEGIMLKRKDSPYLVGRKRGAWWKWKIDPLVIDAVMIYAQQGHGRRANLFTDYTFAVWSGDQLVPFAKAYSGLTDAEFQEITTFVRRNTLDRFGPVRSVKPHLVFEIAFEGIQASKRHKSGVALRFPRMSRWRKDKHPKEANTLEDLNAILALYG
ncbi:MAG: ATP-dependent DNA ligase [Saprospiraceae bacterium]|nr:ATP-dependent DNA ligase [Saprospiraceae bacterium]